MKVKLFYISNKYYCDECLEEARKSITPATNWEEMSNEDFDLLTKYGRKDSIICIAENSIHNPEPYLPNVSKYLEKYKKQELQYKKDQEHKKDLEAKRLARLEATKAQRLEKRLVKIQTELESCKKV